MSIRGKAFIAGIYEHPTRLARDKTLAQLHADVARGALADAGLAKEDVDGFFCDGSVPGFGALTLANYMGLKLRHTDTTESGGSAPILHVGHAAQAIAEGKCRVALITSCGRPRAAGVSPAMPVDPETHEDDFDVVYGCHLAQSYGMVARRHMHDHGTTSEQLAWIKVAASHHAQHNPHAMLPKVVTVEEVLASPMVADPLHRLDCCVISDGGGAIVVVHPDIARELKRPMIRVRGAGEAVKIMNGGWFDLASSAGAVSGATAFDEAAVKASDIQYVSLYDSFTITVLMQLEDLGFCERGEGGKFVADGGLISGVGRLPFNTDGGGLCSNHPGNRGGITKVMEAVRQARGEAHPKVQVPNCGLVLAHGTGGSLGQLHEAATLILERI